MEKTSTCKHQLIGSEVRVFSHDDSLMFPFGSCQLVTITDTYIIVLLDREDEGGFFSVIPLAEISLIDTLPEHGGKEDGS